MTLTRCSDCEGVTQRTANASATHGRWHLTRSRSPTNLDSLSDSGRGFRAFRPIFVFRICAKVDLEKYSDIPPTDIEPARVKDQRTCWDWKTDHSRERRNRERSGEEKRTKGGTEREDSEPGEARRKTSKTAPKTNLRRQRSKGPAPPLFLIPTTLHLPRLNLVARWKSWLHLGELCTYEQAGIML